MSDVERHPFTPFLPEGCKLLMLGSFPPAKKRWCMDFYYPNFMNDMWRIFGIIFFNDKNCFVDIDRKTFLLDDIITFLNDKKIGLYDTATAVRRLKNTASDKDLEVVEPTDIGALLAKIPCCEAIVTTGQKATDVLCDYFDIDKQPAVGAYVTIHYDDRKLRLYRMPSSSRAYPMRVEYKAEKYKPTFDDIINQ